MKECKMIVNYSDQEVIKSEKSIFLAGPTPRKKDIISWRKTAVKILRELGFDGVVYVPERENDQEDFDFVSQVEWETDALKAAGVIVFWIPRELPDMPAFTTNVEFGEWYKFNKTIYGRPDYSEKNRYLDKKYFMETKRLPFSDLTKMLKFSVDKLNGIQELDLRNCNELGIVKFVMNTYIESYYLVGETDFTPESYNYDSDMVESTYGKYLFPIKKKDKLKEFDRTMLSIVLYYYLKHDCYSSFILCQDHEVALKLDEFKKLREFVFSVINTREKEYLLLYYIVINDIGKTNFVKQFIQEMEIDNSIDHDVVLKHCLKNLPTFKLLNDSDKKLLKNVIDYGINLGQFIQGESVSFSLKILENLNENEINFMLVEAILDIAGVYGHINQQGSLSLNHNLYNNIEIAIKSINNYCNKNEDPYINYIKEKSKQYNLDCNHFRSVAVTRICLMLTINEQQDVNIVKEELSQYPILINELNVNGFLGKAILLYYCPALLRNTLNYFKNNNTSSPLLQCLKVCLPFMERVYKYVRKKYNAYDEDTGVITVMLREAAIIASTSPEKLEEFDLEQLETEE